MTLLLLVGVGLSSCTSDDDEVFSQSAAERIAAAVEQDKAILESAENGWQMVLWTGSDYSGGGFNMFMKFKDGKVITASDIAPDSVTYQSSYDVIKDQGPVLTFNTYNPAMHYMAEPSTSALSGNQGDYEFIIQRATKDSIFLKGKKYGNKTVMTRIPSWDGVSATIRQMQSNTRAIAGYFTDGKGDSIIVDPSERRLYPDSKEIDYSLPYVATTDGIRCAGDDEALTWDAEAQTLTKEGRVMTNAKPDAYNSIDNWVGTWGIRYIGSTYNEETGYYTNQFDTLQLTLDYEEDLIGQKAAGALKGTIYVQGYPFELIVYYSPVTGRISIPAQYIADPTDTYDMFLLLGTNAASFVDGNYAWYAVDWNVTWDATEQMYTLVGDNSSANGLDMDVLQILAVNSSGQIIASSAGSPIALLTLTYPDYVFRIEN